LDRVLAGFILATGAAAMGQQVTMFFTFWGYGALHRQKREAPRRFLVRPCDRA
jgi:peroxiredoxin family protein